MAMVDSVSDLSSGSKPVLHDFSTPPASRIRRDTHEDFSSLCLLSGCLRFPMALPTATQHPVSLYRRLTYVGERGEGQC